MKKRKTQDEMNLINAQKGILTVEQVVWIKMELSRGVAVQDIADILVMSYQTIARIRDGKTWNWVKTLDDAVKVQPSAITPSLKYAADASLARFFAENQGILTAEPAVDDTSGLDKLNQQVTTNVDIALKELKDDVKARAAFLAGKEKEA